VSDWTVSITLTYAPRDDLAERVITPRHLQDFIRALRKRGHKIRYIACGEVGKLRARAHFHVIVFGRGNRPDIPHKAMARVAEWPHGHVFADWTADERALRYVCKYVLKGEGQSWVTMSKKPPLGAAFFSEKAAEACRLGVFPSSFQYLPPGGQRKRPYLMTGATRRDYLLALVAGMPGIAGEHRHRLGEWVERSLAKVEQGESVKADARRPASELLDALQATCDAARMSPRALDAYLRREAWADLWQEAELPWVSEWRRRVANGETAERPARITDGSPGLGRGRCGGDRTADPPCGGAAVSPGGGTRAGGLGVRGGKGTSQVVGGPSRRASDGWVFGRSVAIGSGGGTPQAGVDADEGETFDDLDPGGAGTS